MQPHYIIGTAGHIDHGKTTLTKALTGIDTDRLKEEKDRAISIELGFAPLDLPDGSLASLIDVPGHERFIRHMVAGVSGMDLVMLIIAADEGVMPQTREHLHIIQLLGIRHMIVVLTKTDLVDNELLMLVHDDVKEQLKGTTFENAPVCEVSAATGKGIETLKRIIQDQLKKIEPKPASGFFQLPIDRVFSLKGIGTVVTGTVYSGKAKSGEELELMPAGKRIRVRGLQVHNRAVETVFAGERAAVNLTGVDIDEVTRGDVLVTPGQFEPTTRIDIKLTLLDDLDFTLKQRVQVKFHIGTNEVMGSLILFDRKEIQPGDTVYAQIVLTEPIICSRGERFIIRRPSPAVSVGGGEVIEPNATRHKHRPETVEQLRTRSEGSLGDLVIQEIVRHPNELLNLGDLSRLLTQPEDALKAMIEQLIQENKILAIKGEDQTIYVTPGQIEAWKNRLIQILEQFHRLYPLRAGMLKAELAKKILTKSDARRFQMLIDRMALEKVISDRRDTVSLHDYTPKPDTKMQEQVNRLLYQLRQEGLAPIAWEDLLKAHQIPEKLGGELQNYLIQQQQVIKMGEKFVIDRQSYENAAAKLTAAFAGKTITLQDAKSLFDLSRKHLVPLMELFDQEKVTLRRPDNTRLIRKSS